MFSQGRTAGVPRQRGSVRIAGEPAGGDAVRDVLSCRTRSSRCAARRGFVRASRLHPGPGQSATGGGGRPKVAARRADDEMVYERRLLSRWSPCGIGSNAPGSKAALYRTVRGKESCFTRLWEQAEGRSVGRRGHRASSTGAPSSNGVGGIAEKPCRTIRRRRSSAVESLRSADEHVIACGRTKGTSSHWSGLARELVAGLELPDVGWPTGSWPAWRESPGFD